MAKKTLWNGLVLENRKKYYPIINSSNSSLYYNWDPLPEYINREGHPLLVLASNKPTQNPDAKLDLLKRKYQDIEALKDAMAHSARTFLSSYPGLPPIQEFNLRKYVRGVAPEEVYYDCLLPILDHYNLAIRWHSLHAPIYDLSYIVNCTPYRTAHVSIGWISDLVRPGIWCPFIPEELDFFLRHLSGTKWWDTRPHMEYSPKPRLRNSFVCIPEFMIDRSRVSGCLGCRRPTTELLCRHCHSQNGPDRTYFFNVVYNHLDLLKDEYIDLLAKYYC